MGLRDRLMRLLERGDPDHEEIDPDAIVELAIVPLSYGPMLLTKLEEAGIKATGHEAFNIVTDTRSHMRIMVRQSDLDAARVLVDRFR